MSQLNSNLSGVRQRIEAACPKGKTVQLIAVSKGQSAELLLTALEAGQRVFGENRVQEAKAKFEGLRAGYPDLELHLIGPLQTNKAEEAVKYFDVIQTLDRPKLAEALAKAIRKIERTPRLYAEVNIGAEPQKAGLHPAQLPEFLKFCRDECGLVVSGLMCIPPQGDEPAIHFQRMKELASAHGLPHLSMGMSGDFETAIKCGATEVRVGTAIFGKREV